jgi:hypothetical protein
LGTLTITTVASLIKVRRSPEAAKDIPAPEPQESVHGKSTDPR